MFALIWCRAGDKDVTKLRVPVQRYSKIDIHQSVGFIGLNLRLHLGFEESVALKKLGECISCLLDVDRRIRFLRYIIRSLKQTRIWKAFGSGKLINSEIRGRLRYKHDAYAFQFRPQVHLYILELSRTLERDDALFDLRRRERLAGALGEDFCKFLDIEIGTARHFHGGGHLALVREKFGSLDSR